MRNQYARKALARLSTSLLVSGAGAALFVSSSALADDAPAGAPAPVSQPAATPAVDPAVLQKLIDRLDKQDALIKAQDAQIKELKDKAATPPPPPPAPAPAPEPTTIPDVVKKRLDKQDSDIASVKLQLAEAAKQENEGPQFPQIQFHVFGDVDYHVSNLAQDRNAFTLGEFDVFVSGQIAPDLSILTETVISGGPNNYFGIEVERIFAEYQYNEHVVIDFGRFHTMMGYYNTAYHHGTWFQNATGRPAIVNFEDSGGIVPTHSVGLNIHGSVPGGEKLGLSYYFEVANNRAYQTPTAVIDPVDNIYENYNFKSTNIGFICRPEAVEGLQFGAGFYHDEVAPTGVHTDEMLFDGHIVYHNAEWEFLSEGYLWRHAPEGMGEQWSTAGYVQLAHKFGKWTPYVRFTYLNASTADPIWNYIGQQGRHYDPAIGVRYDLSAYLALKTQLDYVVNHGPYFDLGPTFNPVPAGNYYRVSIQAAFTF